VIGVDPTEDPRSPKSGHRWIGCLPDADPTFYVHHYEAL
jgi:hypothetical protein